MPEEKSTKIEIGRGTAKGENAFIVGQDATQQALSTISQYPLSAVMVFASIRYDLEKLLEGVQSVTGTAPLLGATTAGEIFNAPQKGSVVVVALASPFLKAYIGVGKAVSHDWRQAVKQAVSTPELSPYFSPNQTDHWSKLTRQGKAFFGVLFSPGNTRYADSRSYEILEELKHLSEGRIPFFGGSSADDWHMEGNYVLCGQNAYPDGVLVAVFETQLRFGIGLAHGLRPSSRRATVTKAKDHKALMLDGQPAAERYAQLLGTTKQALDGKHLTLTTGQPTGFPDSHGQYSINVASYFTPSGGIRFAQPTPEGALLTIMDANPENMVTAGQDALRKALIRGEITMPAVAFVCSCALRSRILGDLIGQEIICMQEITDVPLVGFYSFGEQGLADDGVNRHNNEVVAVLALGQQLSYAAQVALENEHLRLQLIDRERRFRSIIAQSHNGVTVTDEEGTIVAWNLRLQNITGIPAADAIGRPVWDVQYEMMPPQERTLTMYEQSKAKTLAVLETGQAEWLDEFIEREYVHPDGHHLSLQMGISAIETDRGFLLVGTARDVTQRKQAEHLLRIQRDLGIALNTARGLDEILPLCLQTAIYASNMDSGAIYLLNEDKERFEMIYHEGLPADLVETMSSHAVDSPGAKLVLQDRSTFTKYAHLPGYVPEIGIEAGLSAVAVIPMKHEGQSIGALVVTSHTIEEIPELARTTLETVAAQIEQAIARARAEEALRESEQQYRTLFTEALNPILLVDEGGRYIDANQAALDFLECSLDELLGKMVWDFSPPEMLDQQQEEHAPFEQPRTLETDYLVHGKIKTLLLNVVPVKLHNQTLLYGIGHEITERKRAEKALRRLAALQEVRLEITSQLKLNTLLHSIVARAIDLLEAAEGGLYLYRPDQEMLEWVVAIGPNIAPIGSKLKKGEGLSGKVWQTDKPIIVDDYTRWEGRADIYDHYPFTATIGVPIRWGQPGQSERFLGVLNVLAEPPRTFSQEDAELLSMLASQAAIAIQNARLFDTERQQRELTEALEKAALAVNSTLNVDQVFDLILDQVTRIFPGDAFGITLVENETAHTIRWRGPGSILSTPPTEHIFSFDDFPELKEMASTGKPSITADAAATLTADIPEEWKWIRSYVSAPIRVADETMGFLHVISDQPNRFTSADARHLEIFASHAATAIQNAQLHQKLIWYTEELEQHVAARTDELRRQYAQLEAVLYSNSDGIIVIDAQDQILRANPIARNWLEEELPPEDATRLRAAIIHIARQVSTRAFEQPDGEAKMVLELSGVDLELNAAPILEGQKSTATVVNIHDVTHLKSVERMKTRLITNISHELRTPIATTQSYAYLLQTTPPEDEKYQEYLEALVQETEHQARLGDEILQISRIYAGKLTISPELVNIDKLVPAIIDQYHSEEPKTDIVWKEHSKEEEIPVWVDIAQMAHVLNDLIDNAIQFSPTGSQVTITTARKNHWGTISVADRGASIPEADQPHLFERFLREEEPQTSRISNTGLRLMIAKEIVERHGGEITVKSPVTNDGRGVRFTIWLPLAAPRPEQR